MTREKPRLALETIGVSKAFGKTKALTDLSLAVEYGECFALLGPNGAGKTTTAELLEGYLEPDSGEVFVAGRRYRESRREIQRRIGVVLQETHLYGRYTVGETLSLFASFHGKRGAEGEIMERLQLADKRAVRLEKLSGGERQRVYIGCAVIHEPEILFLDEPTAGLDPGARQGIWEVIADYRRRGRCVFLTTHYLEEAERLADRVAIMDQGRVAAVGTTTELIGAHCSREVLSFRLGSGDDLQRLRPALPWLGDSRPEVDGWVHVPAKESDQQIQQLVAASQAASTRITGIHVGRGSLEDVFFSITGRAMSREGSTAHGA